MDEHVDAPGVSNAAAGPPALDGELTFIGTATVLLRYGGFTVLTDPNFLHRGEVAPLGWGLRSRRRTDPAIELRDLPPIDLVVLSHHHGDHFDPVVVREMDKDQPIVTEPHSAKKLRRQGFRNVVALDTWASHTLLARGPADLVVTAVPGRHAPGPFQALVPKVMGSVLTFTHLDVPSLHVYVTGDTLYGRDLVDIPSRFPEIDLCVLHLGGTRIAGVLLTMDDEQGVRMLRLVQPKVAVPVHHADYPVFRSPLADFLDEVHRSHLHTHVVTLAPGETLRVRGTLRGHTTVDRHGPSDVPGAR